LDELEAQRAEKRQSDTPPQPEAAWADGGGDSVITGDVSMDICNVGMDICDDVDDPASSRIVALETDRSPEEDRAQAYQSPANVADSYNSFQVTILLHILHFGRKCSWTNYKLSSIILLDSCLINYA
jgi:hypothetical protein